jgi:hypothetical protein
MRTIACVVVALLAGVLPSVAQEKPVTTDHDMLRKYLTTTYGLSGALRVTVFSGWDQWRDNPPIVGQGPGSFGKRWASKYAEAAIGSTAKFGVAALFHQDPSFTKCDCTGVGPRLRHAMVSPFVARTRDGRQVVSGANLAGYLTGHIVAKTTWYPAQYGAADGLRSAGSSLALATGMNVFKEFRPRSKK